MNPVCKNLLTKFLALELFQILRGKEKRHPQIFSYRILLYIHISPRGVVSFDFRSWISLSGSKPNVSTSKSVQPHRLYNKREREKRKRKKIARKFSTVGHSSVSSSEKERVKKRDREKEENNKFLSLPFSLESKCI